LRLGPRPEQTGYIQPEIKTHASTLLIRDGYSSLAEIVKSG
jgi:hypothetical protein